MSNARFLTKNKTFLKETGCCFYLQLLILKENHSLMKLEFTLLFLFTSYGIAFSQAKGEPVYIHSIFFGGGDYRIDEEQIGLLDDFLNSIPNIHEFQIEVHGHTDDIGSKAYNQWLSEMRSTTTVEQLVAKDILREVIFIKDFGESSPVYDNNTWEGKLKNRRVDIVFRKIMM